MSIGTIVLVILGLGLFEIVSSIDNAVINADVLSTMQPKSRRWFSLWGLIFAVFVVRGLLPWVIIWAVNPSIGPIGALVATFSSNESVKAAVEQTAPALLAGGGTFLIFLFFNWLFLEEKNFGLPHEKFFARQGIWFFAVVSLILLFLVWLSLGYNSGIALGAVVGSTVFFTVHGFKQYAERDESRLIDSDKSDVSKILFLEIIDATFSIDGVLGAFAFTLSVPLIILGNGIGAIVVRQLTVGNIDRIKRYKFIKNGAMYSILALGTIMLLDGFGVDIPQWLSPVITFIIVGFFFVKSKNLLRADLA